MTLSCFDIGLELVFQENKVNVLVIEECVIYTDFLNRIMQQQSGIDSGLSVYDEENKISLTKEIILVHSPLLIDVNCKRMQTYLYNELKTITNEYYFDVKEKLNAAIIEYFDLVTEKLPYPIKFNLDMDVNLLYKQYDVAINYEEQSLLEKVLNFIQLEKTLCNTKLIIFVNLKAYFSSEQLHEIYKCAFYNKLHILVVESMEICCLQEEKYYIIDKDRCLITHQ